MGEVKNREKKYNYNICTLKNDFLIKDHIKYTFKLF